MRPAIPRNVTELKDARRFTAFEARNALSARESRHPLLTGARAALAISGMDDSSVNGF
jgi:hypothetical protein